MKHEVVVLGGGYAGLPAAKRLARRVRAEEVSVTLVTAFPDFVERPRLHQLATGQAIRIVPIADYLDGSGVELLVGSATGIDLAARTVAVSQDGDQRVLRYDTLIYALGSNIDTAQVPGVAEHACSLVGTDAAAGAREGLRALADGARVSVCGGGLTGIEIAAEVAESFPSLDVTLVSGSAPGHWLSDRARIYLARTFGQLGVTVQAGERVHEVCPDGLVLDRGRRVSSDLCLWAGGFQVPTLARDSGLAVNQDDRAVVDLTLQSVSHPGVYVIGDAAAVAGPWGVQLAMGCRSGGFTGPKVADVVAARLTGRAPDPFRFRYFHECVSLGRRHGLVQFLNADESPKRRVLTGRAAIAYKNLTLNGAKLVFRHSGPFLARRRALSPAGRAVSELDAARSRTARR